MSEMEMELPRGAARVQTFLDERQPSYRVELLAKRAASAADAAAALGTSVERIGKTIVFGNAGTTVAAVLCGDDRVDARALELASSASGLRTQPPDEVRERTGFVIGGVSPFGLPSEVLVVCDRRFLELDYAWVAAGHPNTVVRVVPARTIELCGGSMAAIRELP